MNILLLNASKSESMTKINDLCRLTLEELEGDVQELNILPTVLNEEILRCVKSTEGIVIITDMRMNSIPASLQNFFELFEISNTEVIKGKVILPIIISDKYNAIDGYKIILSNIIQLDCIESGRVFGASKLVKKSYIQAQLKNLSKLTKLNKGEELTKENLSSLMKMAEENIKAKESVETKKLSKNEENILELAELFKQQLSKKIGTDIQEIGKKETILNLTEVTVEQMTRNLTHYFQAQLANDMNSTYQINVTGKEEFSGFLEINKKNCEYIDGVTEKADVIVNVDSETWRSVLKGIITAQKAFMTGKIKVKGDFGLLSKFDKLFKK